MKPAKKILLTIVILFFAFFFASGIAFLAVTKNARLDENRLALSKDEIRVFDKNDEAVHTLAIGAANRNFSVSALPEQVKFAFIDTEDKRFYSHGGVDYIRLARAAWNNFRTHSFKEGASTISQQLIKNTHLSQEKTIKRKLLELKLTSELEARYTKDEILEKYLNSIYFGHSCFGVKSAAQFYFSKSPEDLTLADGALLAGIVKSPNNYSPFKNPAKCRSRRALVLEAMQKNGHISETEKLEAESEPLPVQNTVFSADSSYLARCYDELERLADENSLRLNGKIRIFTYLDQSLQKALSDTCTLNGTDERSDIVSAALDLAGGGFAAYYSTCGDIARSPASLFKPLCAYAPAFEEGLLSPATPIDDSPARFGEYSPKNYGGAYGGYLSARECIARSLNVPAVKILNSLSLEKSRAYLEKLGLQTDPDDFSLAAALGGVKRGYTLPELLSAYSAFARGGNYRRAGFIRRIEIDGRAVYDATSDVRKAEKRAFSEETAALVTDVLKTCAQSGTAKKLRSLPFETAAKTGTNGDKNGNFDAYALAYTPKIAAAVWLGNADRTRISATGGGLPCNKLYSFLRETQQNGGADRFTMPQSIVKIALDKTDYERDHKLTIADDFAPENYKTYEIFDSRRLPLARSTKFSHPTIAKPLIEYENGTVKITVSDDSPECYEYLIERKENDEKRVIYRGKLRDVFADAVENGKIYEYSVTPFYKEIFGDTIVLPAVSTKNNLPANPSEPPDIIGRDWWDL